MAQTKLSETLLNDIINQLKPLDPDKVLVFGSYAWGEPNEDSDIDLFIVKKSASEDVRRLSLEAMRCLRPLIFKYKKGFDVLLDDPGRIRGRIENLHDLFYEEVLEKGVAIYAK